VRQILVHLLTNAVKFTPAGGRITVAYGRADRPRLDVQLPGARSWIYVSVADTGPGIPQEQLGRIFDPFVQVQSGHTRTVEGSGLGLTMSRRLAHLMKGEVTAHSESGKGSTFTLWLTSAEEDDSADESVHAVSNAGSDGLLGLADVGVALQSALQSVLATTVGRIRDEGLTPNIGSLRFPQLAAHLSSYIATLATTLIAMQEAGDQPSALVADGSDIMRTLADRHGTHRQRLGWTAPALEREWLLLSEELQRVVRTCARTVAEPVLAEADKIIARFVDQATAGSLRSHARAEGEEGR
jgi:hypothetical protein